MPDVLSDLRSVSMSYGETDAQASPVLEDVTCRVEAQDRIAVLGPSGSGKSTLLNLLAGLAAPDSGTIGWPALGSMTDLRPANVQLVPQTSSLLPALDVLSNVALPLILIGRDPGTAAHHAARAMLERFGLDDLAERLPEDLSGGQAQRVAVVRALVVRPRLMLADEPTGQLDSATAKTFLTTLLDVVEESRAALVVATHDQRIASRLKKVWLIEHGHLRVQHETEEIKT